MDLLVKSSCGRTNLNRDCHDKGTGSSDLKDPHQSQQNGKPWNQIVKELKKCVILCKNCHAEHHHPKYTIEGTTGQANKKLEYENYSSISFTGNCPCCGVETYGTKFCSVKCTQLSQRKVLRPTKEQLILDIDEFNWTTIGKKYGVSDNAVRKWARIYNIIPL